MFPPHLPPPTSSLSRHRQWERLKLILVSTIFGMMAGISGAAVLLGWIWPMNGLGENFFLSRFSSISREQLQNRAQLKIADEVFSIYQKSTVLGKARYFSESDKVADSVMSVTSGWVLAYLPNFDGRTKDWVAVAENGSLYSISKTLFDRRTGLLYLKLDSMVKIPEVRDEQFKVATFNGTLKQYDEVFVLQDGRWQSAVVTGRVPGNSESHLDSVVMLTYNLNDSFRTGSVVIDGAGNMIGFVTDKSLIVSLANESYFLNGIEEKKQLTYPSLGIEGWYSDEKLLVLNEEKLTGFVVVKVVGNRQFFQRGDILIEINGRPADRSSLWNSFGNSKIRVKVWRNGKIIDGQINMVQI